MLSKRDFKCLRKFAKKNSIHPELDFILVRNGGFFATDSFRAIFFHIPAVACDNLLVHKKILKGFEATMNKHESSSIESSEGNVLISSGGVCLSLATQNLDCAYPDVFNILGKKFKSHFVLSSLDDIQFELAERLCFIDSSLLEPILYHNNACYFDIFFTPLPKEDSGVLKIIAYIVRENTTVEYFTAFFMSREFRSKAK